MRKLGGIAAICAMLLLSLAPVASQTLEHARIDALLASVCASDAHAQPLAPNADTHQAQHDVSGHLQACAYCDLIAHAPTPPAPPHRDTVAQPMREAFDARPLTASPRRELINAAQPRAPPALA